jgi:hypothetical protein
MALTPLKALRLVKARFEGDSGGRVMREGCKSSGASEVRGSGAGDFRPRERRLAREDANRKGKCISCEDVTDARAGWASQDNFGLR